MSNQIKWPLDRGTIVTIANHDFTEIKIKDRLTVIDGASFPAKKNRELLIRADLKSVERGALLVMSLSSEGGKTILHKDSQVSFRKPMVNSYESGILRPTIDIPQGETVTGLFIFISGEFRAIQDMSEFVSM